MSLMKIKTTVLTLKDIKSSVKLYTGSVAYLKKLLPITITNIIYNRVDFDNEPLFTDHTMNNIPYKTMSSKITKKHKLFSVYHWINEALASLQKKYLKEMCLVIRDAESEEVMENYSISIQYNPEDTKKLPVGQAVVDATSKFFADLNTLGDLEKLLAPNIKFALQIILNEDAPADYPTLNFEKGQLVKPVSNNTLRLGSISTGYHKVKVNAQGDLFQLEDDADDADDIPLEDNIEQTVVTEESALNNIHSEPVSTRLPDKNKSKLSLHHLDADDEEIQLTDDLNINSEVLPEVTSPIGSENLELILQTIEDEDDEFSAPNISCLCELAVNIEGIPTILCTECKKYQHVACIGYTHKTIEQHTCLLCCEKLGKKCADLRSKSQTEKQRTFLAIARLTGTFMANTKKSPEYIIEKIASDKRMIYVTGMVRIGIINKKGKRIIPAPEYEKYLKKITYEQEKAVVDDAVSIADSEDNFTPATKKQKL